MSSSARKPAQPYPHCRSCGSWIDPQIIRVVGDGGTVPVCGNGDCAEDLSYTGAEITSTVRAVKAFHQRGGAP